MDLRVSGIKQGQHRRGWRRPWSYEQRQPQKISVTTQAVCRTKKWELEDAVRFDFTRCIRLFNSSKDWSYGLCKFHFGVGLLYRLFRFQTWRCIAYAKMPKKQEANSSCRSTNRVFESLAVSVSRALSAVLRSLAKACLSRRFTWRGCGTFSTPPAVRART